MPGPSEAQIEAGARALASIALAMDKAFDQYDTASKAGFMRQSKVVLDAAFNTEEPYTEEDKKYDFALKTTDEINGPGTYAEINRHNPNPMIQRAITRFYKELRGG